MVSDIPAGDGKTVKLFLQCSRWYRLNLPKSPLPLHEDKLASRELHPFLFLHGLHFQGTGLTSCGVVYHEYLLLVYCIKRSLTRDFQLKVFFMNQFPLGP